MKQSLFNTRLHLSENTDILFNSFSEKSVIVKKDTLLPIGMSKDQDYLETILTDAGFFCDDSEDEVIKVKNIFLQSTDDDSCFRLTVNPTLRCNFRCWYCYEQHDDKPRMKEDTLTGIKNLISQILDRFHQLELAFFGGEPLLEFNSIVLPLIEYTDALCKTRGKSYNITFTTNGFLISDEIINKLRKYHIGTSQITLDGGPDFHNKTRVSAASDSFLTIVGNIRKLVRADLPVLIRVNLTKENSASALEIPAYFKDWDDSEKRCLNILVQQVWQDGKNDVFDETWELYTAFIEVGIKPRPVNFNFYKTICYADRRHSAVVNYDGRIFKCTAIDFDVKKEDGVLPENGTLDIEHTFEKRLEKRFSNELCKRCRILPLCNGGCSKNVDQAKDILNYCLHPSEEDKDKVVKRVIKEQILFHRLGIQ